MIKEKPIILMLVLLVYFSYFLQKTLRNMNSLVDHLSNILDNLFLMAQWYKQCYYYCPKSLSHVFDNSESERRTTHWICGKKDQELFDCVFAQWKKIQVIVDKPERSKIGSIDLYSNLLSSVDAFKTTSTRHKLHLIPECVLIRQYILFPFFV